MDGFLDENFGMSDSEGKSFSNQGGNSYGGGNSNNNQSSSNNYSGGGNNNANSYSGNNNNQQKSYGGGNNYNGQQKPYGGNNNGGGAKSWQDKAKEVQEPYMPIGVYIDDKFPPEVIEKLIGIVSGLISKGFTVRYNADNLEIHNKIKAMSFKQTEDYSPLKTFNEIESRFGFNSATSNKESEKFWGDNPKIPKIVRMKTSRDVRLVLGNNNKNNIKALITWSPDGARNTVEVSNETGYIGSTIKIADQYHCKVLNINNENSRRELEHTFLRSNNNG